MTTNSLSGVTQLASKSITWSHASKRPTSSSLCFGTVDTILWELGYREVQNLNKVNKGLGQGPWAWSTRGRVRCPPVIGRELANWSLVPRAFTCAGQRACGGGGCLALGCASVHAFSLINYYCN